MNKFITAIKNLDVAAVKKCLKDPKWRSWSEPSGKNALHYLCSLGPSVDPIESFSILKLLLKSGMDIDSVHRIDEKDGYFPATPLWYAYTRGRNEKLYRYLLKKGADPSNCWWAIAWYDDIKAAELWLRHGAKIDRKPSLDDLFLGAFQWKKYAFARWTLDRGANVDARGPGGLTALMLAVKRNDEEAIKMLLKYGAYPDRKSDQGISARKLAETKGPRRISNLF